MIIALLILVPIVGVVGWAFFRFAPKHCDKKSLLRFNLLSLAVSLLLAIGWCVRTYLVMSPSVDSAWWPIISLLGSLFIIPVALGVAAILRNFVLFHR